MSALVSIDQDIPLDGRKARSEKTRAVIVDALMALIQGGNLKPTSEDVASHAGVGHRTVFRHFQDMDTLYQEISIRMKARIDEEIEPPLPDGPLTRRIDVLIKSRSDIFERIKMFRRATMIQAWRSPFLRQNRKHYDAILRRRFLVALPEVKVRPGDIQSAIEVLVSFEAWEHLRVDQGKSIAAAREAMKQSLQLLLK